MFLRCIEDIRKVKFDLVICDEAHRLKNSAIKTATAITGLSINKRILLTGTPIQNNLQEFYTLAEMANPGIFGKLSLVSFPLNPLQPGVAFLYLLQTSENLKVLGGIEKQHQTVMG